MMMIHEYLAASECFIGCDVERWEEMLHNDNNIVVRAETKEKNFVSRCVLFFKATHCRTGIVTELSEFPGLHLKPVNCSDTQMRRTEMNEWIPSAQFASRNSQSSSCEAERERVENDDWFDSIALSIPSIAIGHSIANNWHLNWIAFNSIFVANVVVAMLFLRSWAAFN